MRKEVVLVAAVSTAATIAAVAALVRQRRLRKEQRWKQTQTILRKFARECATPVPRLWQVANALVSEMQASLASNETTADLNMLLSYLASLPNGYYVFSKALILKSFIQNHITHIICHYVILFLRQRREGTLLWDKFESYGFFDLMCKTWREEWAYFWSA